MLAKEALEIKIEEFNSVVEEVTRLVCNEKGKIGNFEVLGRILRIAPYGKALIIGDLHGDLESLVTILDESDFLKKMSQNSNSVIVFLGDYGDRGAYSAEVYHLISRLKLLFPKQIILLRGNHEGPKDIPWHPHDLPVQFQMKFGEKWQTAYSKLRELFNCLYVAVLVEERYLMIHGGFPLQAKTIEDLAYANVRHPKDSFLEDMLWSDPDDEVKYFCASPRGAGKLFGEKITEEFLARFNVKILIRSHESCSEGFKINHHGKVLTIFSRKGPPYFNLYGAYLSLKLSEKFQNAEQLIPFIQRF